MADDLPESGEERIDESGRNPTQRRMDEDEQSGPVDAPWDRVPGDDETELPVPERED